MNFGDKRIEKSNFYKTDKLFKIDGIDVNKILVSKREAFSTKISNKYFLGYDDNETMTLLDDYV